ncbi:MAG: undecaprenyl/decaprenyl-phosphate alpha-N-acetylglucosaminyl 1-phosphate transferase, partial [Phycisphaerae bacterium]|nr:undecaprenyl/decaprenyl-phosphate alpha-N-acetylglucosaminyl 1-phosphate transferase [Phycisphaerae bacterium]NIX26824.1 undecaprenyl/decaprenyl-phosphate alpha-N-acetylglucosaminyl 1-phosphate transferase [Phycisphaerae bacterium]
VLVFFGFKIDWFVSYTYNTFFSVFWIVGITNAFNLLDNMDGLSSGIAFISSLFLAVIT